MAVVTPVVIGAVGSLTVPQPGDTLANATIPSPLIFRADGLFAVLASGIDVTEITAACTITQVVLRRRLGGTSGSTIVDLLKNGVSIYTTPANRPTILFSNTPNGRVVATLPDVLTLVAGDRLEMAIVAVEVGAARRDLALFVSRG